MAIFLKARFDKERNELLKHECRNCSKKKIRILTLKHGEHAEAWGNVVHTI